MLRLFVALIALAAFLVSSVSPGRTRAAVAQETKKPGQQETKKQETKQDTKQEPKPELKQNGKDVKFTAEQIVESVILIYGTRPALEHIRRNGIERGKITRFGADGNAEEANYERRFIRGENLDKDKIRLDQMLGHKQLPPVGEADSPLNAQLSRLRAAFGKQAE